MLRKDGKYHLFCEFMRTSSPPADILRASSRVRNEWRSPETVCVGGWERSLLSCARSPLVKNKKQPIKIEFVFIENQKLISNTLTRAFVVSDKDFQIRRRYGNENVKNNNNNNNKNRFRRQNNNFASAKHFFVHFFAVFIQLRC